MNGMPSLQLAHDFINTRVIGSNVKRASAVVLQCNLRKLAVIYRYTSKVH